MRHVLPGTTKRGIRLLVLSALLMAVFALFPHTVRAAEVYFSDGFESGDTSKWTFNNSDMNGQATVQTQVAHTGTHALALTNTFNPGQISYVYTALSGPQTKAYTRFYVRYSTFDGLSSGTELAIGRNNNDSSVWGVDFDRDVHGLDVYFWDNQGQVHSFISPSNLLKVNTWYCVEVYVNSVTNGHGEVWVNGTSIGSVDANMSNANPYSRLMFFDKVATTTYIDDVVVSDTYNGPTNAGPDVNFAPSSVDFDELGVNSTASRTVTLSNTGASALGISNISISGTNASDFAQTNTCGSSLASGGSCTITVSFHPPATGSRSASLNIATSASGTPYSIPLSGIGVTQVSYFQDNFETGNFTKWTFTNADSTGQASVQTSVTHGGTNAAAFINSANQYSYIYTTMPSGPVTQSFTRLYFRISDTSIGTDIALGRNNNGNNAWEIVYNSGTKGLDAFIWGNNGQIYTLSSPANGIQANTWYSVEIALNQVTSGHAELWLNGTSVGAVDNDLSTTQHYSRLMVLNTSTNHLYIDDINVSASYNGPIS
ncbi:choice-of-anchor D domain-containing protein [Ktedonospora formicarum]|uniref:Cep192/Spd-2-like domain-containing protein n=1 Tax=Ktedonospora formicarum TaxID=2778364 RepID=A0A8J3MVS2_9CHLR|nr:choice-of-anchor D domain-containing protein [Ktedonospora formicarum]GHO46805.1 hypothetical protein KSX_49680 [Ktedonospora formicarum]